MKVGDGAGVFNSSSLAAVFGHVASGNLVKLVTSAILVVFVPLILGVNEYSYYQLFLFVGNYLSLVHFGMVDGVALRFGGERYADLPSGVLRAQFWMLAAYVSAVSICVFLVAQLVGGPEVEPVFVALLFWVPITVLRAFCQALVQATFRMKLFSYILVAEQAIFGVGIVVLLRLDWISLSSILLLEVFRALFAFILYLICCRDVVAIRRPFMVREASRDMRASVASGFFVMSAFLVSALVVGVVRMGVGFRWGLEMFGQVSLVLSMTSFAVAFLTSAGVTLFPLLCRVDGITRGNTYRALSSLLWLGLPLGLCVGYGVQLIIAGLLPEYHVAAKYLPLLFPVFVFDGIMGILLIPFLKALRMERFLLVVNVVAVGLSVAWVGFSVLVVDSFELVLMGVPVVACARCVLVARRVAGRLGVKVGVDIYLGIALVGVFLVAPFLLEGLASILFFVTVGLLVVLVRRSELTSAFAYAWSALMRSREG